MKAIVITQPGDAGVLQAKDYPKPQPADNEVLIQVKASGLNRSDIFQRKGNYAPPPGVPADILGLEAAGVIVECGKDVTKWSNGDAVCALLAGGGYAEFVAVKEGQCLPIPTGFSFIEAASLPETVLTVWSNVFERCALQPGETLLVHGGSSGIGITAIQLAHALHSKVAVTVGTDDKGKKCLELGADSFINYTTHDFKTVLENEGVDVILDMVGGEYFQKNLDILKPDGRLVHINSIKGDTVNVSIRQIMQKRLTITGTMLRNRDYAFKAQLIQSVFENVWPLIQEGKFKPVIYKTFHYTQAAEAHQQLEKTEHTGKIIIEWD